MLSPSPPAAHYSGTGQTFGTGEDLSNNRVYRGMFLGVFHSRVWESESDVREMMQGSFLDTPMKVACADACMEVENGFGMASICISEVGPSTYIVRAMFEGKSADAVTEPCHECGCATYGGEHPFNGCSTVVVREVMDL